MMNKLLLILCLCAATVVSKADGDILNQDFSSGFDKIGPNDVVFEREGWTVSGCEWFKPDAILFPHSLIFEYSKNGDFSYIISPKFGDKVTNNVVVAFSYARFTINSRSGISSFSVKINGGGIFESGTDIANYDITTEQGVFNNATLKIFGAKPSTTITFQLTSTEIYFALNSVKVTSVNDITFDENSDNSSNIVAKTADVSLARTLTGGIWNTLCLPFDVNQTILKQALGDEQDIQLRTYSSYDDGAMNFSSVESVEAGTPFLIKLSETVSNPIFECVEVKDVKAQTVTHNKVSLVGVYSPETLPDDGDNVYMFLSTDGRLMKPSGSNRTLKGLRAYFVAPVGVAARLILGDEEVTSIDNTIRSTTTDGVWYVPNGVRYAQQPIQKGLYIKDGKKMIIK